MNLSAVVAFVFVNGSGEPLPNIDVHVTIIGDPTHGNQYLVGQTDAKGGVRWPVTFDPPQNSNPNAGVYGVQGRANDPSGIYREKFFSGLPVGPRVAGGSKSSAMIEMEERPKPVTISDADRLARIVTGQTSVDGYSVFELLKEEPRPITDADRLFDIVTGRTARKAIEPAALKLLEEMCD